MKSKGSRQVRRGTLRRRLQHPDLSSIEWTACMVGRQGRYTDHDFIQNLSSRNRPAPGRRPAAVYGCGQPPPARLNRGGWAGRKQSLAAAAANASGAGAPDGASSAATAAATSGGGASAAGTSGGAGAAGTSGGAGAAAKSGGAGTATTSGGAGASAPPARRTRKPRTRPQRPAAAGIGGVPVDLDVASSVPPAPSPAAGGRGSATPTERFAQALVRGYRAGLAPTRAAGADASPPAGADAGGGAAAAERPRSPAASPAAGRGGGAPGEASPAAPAPSPGGGSATPTPRMTQTLLCGGAFLSPQPRRRAGKTQP